MSPDPVSATTAPARATATPRPTARSRSASRPRRRTLWRSPSRAREITIGSATRARWTPTTTSHTVKARMYAPKAPGPARRPMSTPSTKFDVDDRIWSVAVSTRSRFPARRARRRRRLPMTEPSPGSAGCPSTPRSGLDGAAAQRRGARARAPRAAPSSRRSDRAASRRRPWPRTTDPRRPQHGAGWPRRSSDRRRRSGARGWPCRAGTSSRGGSSEPDQSLENTIRKSASVELLLVVTGGRRARQPSSLNDPSITGVHTSLPEYSVGANRARRLAAVVVAHVQDTDAGQDALEDRPAVAGVDEHGPPPVLDELPGHAQGGVGSLAVAVDRGDHQRVGGPAEAEVGDDAGDAPLDRGTWPLPRLGQPRAVRREGPLARQAHAAHDRQRRPPRRCPGGCGACPRSSPARPRCRCRRRSRRARRG